jgi:hypothetical protein
MNVYVKIAMVRIAFAIYAGAETDVQKKAVTCRMRQSKVPYWDWAKSIIDAYKTRPYKHGKLY